MNEDQSKDQLTGDGTKKTYTPEEIQQYKDKMKAHYEKELPFLRLQEEYERLNSNIAQHRLTEAMANQRFAQFMMSNKPQPSESDKK